MIEMTLWMALPMLVSAVLGWGTVALARLGRSFGQTLAAVAALGLLVAADVQLWQTWRGAWPTFLPHAMIVATLPILIGQAGAIIRAEERRSTVRTADPTTKP